jgi:hypothetical protein
MNDRPAASSCLAWSIVVFMLSFFPVLPRTTRPYPFQPCRHPANEYNIKTFVSPMPLIVESITPMGFEIGN